jgi:hypothetical protein
MGPTVKWWPAPVPHNRRVTHCCEPCYHWTMATTSMAISPIQCNCCCRHKWFGQTHYRRSVRPYLMALVILNHPMVRPAQRTGHPTPKDRSVITFGRQRFLFPLDRLFGRSRSAVPVEQSCRCTTGEDIVLVLVVALSGATRNVVKQVGLVGRRRWCCRAA